VTEERVKRKLAAIVAADVVGWSRLMGADEAGTLATLKRHRKELIDPKIAEYGGRIVKTTGDGLLVEYPSAVDAVRCSVEVQEAMGGRNADAPEDKAMVFRVGVNLGEVIIDGDDVFGDGVNVAARLEALTEPGGVSISGNVHEQVVGKLPFSFVDGGAQTVKNIAQPIHVWTWPAAAPVSDSAPAASIDVAQPVQGFEGRPAIAVLPFDNMSGDAEQEYFVDGITEDIITGLSLWRWFPVIARNSTFTYKSQNLDVKQVGRELGARYVLEGSVRKAGNRVRITGQLIDTETGAHVWAERFDRDLEDIFDLQDEITERVVVSIAPEIDMAEQQRASRKPPSALGAWDLNARGTWLMNRYTREENAEARACFERAAELDPKWSWPRGYVALTHIFDLTLGWAPDPRQALSEAVNWGKAALDLDEKDPLGHMQRALGLVFLRQPDQAVEHAERAVELNPSLSMAHMVLGYALSYAGRPSEALDELATAMRLDPRDLFYTTFTLSHAALAHLMLRDLDAAVVAARKALQLSSKNIRAHHRLTCALAHLGDLDGARRALADANAVLEKPTIEYFDATYPFTNPEDRDFFLNGLRKAGWEG
jgi:adenylate cyclase